MSSLPPSCLKSFGNLSGTLPFFCIILPDLSYVDCQCVDYRQNREMGPFSDGSDPPHSNRLRSDNVFLCLLCVGYFSALCPSVHRKASLTAPLPPRSTPFLSFSLVQQVGNSAGKIFKMRVELALNLPPEKQLDCYNHVAIISDFAGRLWIVVGLYTLILLLAKYIVRNHFSKKKIFKFLQIPP